MKMYIDLQIIKHVLQLAPEKAKIQSTSALETVSVILDIST